MSEHSRTDAGSRPATGGTPGDARLTPASGRGRSSGGWIASSLLLATLVATGGALAVWKMDSIRDTDAAAASQPEPMEAVSVATAETRLHRQTVTAIGTVLATRSVTLRNELPGTVEEVSLVPGRIVEPGTVLVKLDVSVEEAELLALQAQARLAQTLLDRSRQASMNNAVSEIEVDRARAERDVALAQIDRTKAIIDRKTIRAPFRARVGLADVHRGQYLDAGTVLTTLQGLDEAAHVDFAVPQRVAAGLREGDAVKVSAAGTGPASTGRVVAIDARVDPATRNAMVRVRIHDASGGPAPGASVRVEVPDGPPRPVVGIPVNALRKGPAGDHVFVIEPDAEGSLRAHARPVQSVAALADEILIAEGLSAGEQVAAGGSFKLRESALVAVAHDDLDGSDLHPVEAH